MAYYSYKNISPREIKNGFLTDCKACGCTIPAGVQVIWTPGVGVRHLTVSECAEAKAKKWSTQRAAEEAGPRIDLKSLVDFLLLAQARGLKRPKMRVLDSDGKTELRLSVTTKGAMPGSIGVTRVGEFIGCVRPDGTVTPRIISDKALQDRLLEIAKDPFVAAKQYAVLTGLCCYCDKPLEDEGSVEVGYGPVCARRYGRPHTPKGVPVFTGEETPKQSKLLR